MAARSYSIIDKSSHAYRAVQPFHLVIADAGQRREVAWYDSADDAEWYGQLWGWAGIRPSEYNTMMQRREDARRIAEYAETPAGQRDPRWSW